ncbi:D-glycerate dehydrogenase [Siccirubricoccus sp. KC 17139]|uniref:D-glycerate dehydrogenase n=1 Tax=Siccirubricoccus soli TaxID=2899147 RepID=A0ABT1D9A5_9PROT|nr:D-glycerate dehydrogenase [Siccirubricoccus soli]MCO6418528.1 D-glycerate dehydrogenase [Siccirubricoccus soli]MCP2684663.1 D-glycerate dehydrogenase [Siccirubricoccus soli]
MAKPPLLVTRHLPEAIEARAARDYAAALNPNDEPWSTDAAEIIRRAAAISAQGILCAAGDRLDAACIAGLPASVKLLSTFSVGTDHIDLEAARARGIQVANTPDVLSFATAEIAFTLLLMAARRAGEGERMVRAGQWQGWAPTQLMGVTLEGKTLGILGLGRIGREMAAMARGVRMEVHYHGRRRLAPELEQGAIWHADEAEFLGGIDVLSMHIPGSAATRHWLNAARIARLKRGAIVVNTGRGTTVDDAALIAALQSGQVRAAGLDVYDGEPRVNPGYFALENVVLLPHLGSATVETRDAMGHRALDNLDAVLLRGEKPPFPA